MKDPNEIQKKLFAGDRRALAKAITLIESQKEEDKNLADLILKGALPKSGKSLRIGISGIPGVGKSSFIEVLGLKLIEKGYKVAVLAVDPSSPVSGGSILGDKTRMEELSQSPNAFIRPSPTTGSLGGVANQTRESIYLCEAAGYDLILVETVGVGQSEYQVASMVDLFMVLMVPNAGDELQGIKKGIIELADFLIINKADGDTKVLAENAKSTYQNALQIIKKEKFWSPRVLTCSSLEKAGFEEIFDAIDDFRKLASKDNRLSLIRKNQTHSWLTHLFHQSLTQSIKKNNLLNDRFSKVESRVVEGKLTAREGAIEMINELKRSFITKS
ncbi:MAG: methylmalonyl Co-A mutase-associated GTPase MeaB [Bacteriovoracaceae bacterium]|nr:methylmalonyl Co-A mutase-associated GTPase MeaB [Bacteriovoracaceae bacterium]